MIPVLSFFLERYFVRAGEPSFFLLGEVARAFSHLPYENVTKILKDSRSAGSEQKLRQTEEVLQDHLRWNTGGTCFSLCNALLCVLQDLGFEAFVAMADMHYGRNIHCAVVVVLGDRRFLVDPGYLLHEPIQLPSSGLETVCRTPMNTVFLRNEDPLLYSLYTLEGNTRKWRYRLHAVPTPRDEFVRHWIHSFSLNGMESILLSRLGPEGRLYFRKNTLELVDPLHRSRRKFQELNERELGELFGLPADLILQAYRTCAAGV